MYDQINNLHLPKTGADAHAHLDLKYKSHEVDDIIENAFRAGLSTIIQVFLSPENYQENIYKFSKYPQIYYTLGFHPTDAMNLTEQALVQMEECFLADGRLKAVGEIGLDYYWKDCPADIQDKTLRLQLKLAKKLELPVVIHSREAAQATLLILEEEGFSGRALLWHCFGGDDAMLNLDRILEHGWHISIPGPITYPKNDSLRQIIKKIPRDRLLLETDCPYLAPQEQRGKRNEPAFVAYTAREVAKSLGMDISDLWTLCGQNTRNFFGITDG